ncbi:heavy metal translocating P-type ATPase [Paenibacillus puldeungensis]|uniref:Heavy metal translocating P-type ATPase n=1 Tax=Paenibacillus puldeungensis TaxID=696536 RepID=A0ABW3RR77_9BACL
MEANVRTLTCVDQPQSGLLHKIKPHAELIAALASGGFILAGWLLDAYHYQAQAVALFLVAYVVGGFAKAKEGIEDTIANKELNVELLMIIAAIGSACIGYWVEGAVLIFIFGLSGALETYAMNKSRKEISALMAMQPEEAWRVIDGIEEKIPVSQLNVGDNILIKPGERVPVDGIILEGITTVDESAITGESIPVTKSPGGEVFASTVNLRGSLVVAMTKPNSESLFQKIIMLVQSAQSEKSPSQQFIERFEGPYVKIVLALVGLLLVLPPFVLGWSWMETFYRAMVFLVVASPCALVASVMPATLSAISNGARRGILFKGGVHLENLGKIRAIAFDKTGTLTKGKPEVTDVMVRDDLSEEELLLHAASLEKYSHHPLAAAIVHYAVNKQGKPLIIPKNMEDVAGSGVQGSIEGHLWKVGNAGFVGREDAEQFREGIADELAKDGKTVVFVRDELGIAGLITLKDAVRCESADAVSSLHEEGLHTVMLTGDISQTAVVIAKESGIDSYYASCLPEMKVERLKELKRRFKTIAMVGDGINDAPALATATVGIAMGQGTDVALETADVVLMKNELPKIAEAIRLSKKMNRIIKQNITFSVIVIALLIVSNFMQSLALPMGVLGHEGSTILVILNGLRLLRL